MRPPFENQQIPNQGVERNQIAHLPQYLRDIFDDSFTGIHVDDKELFGEIGDYIQTIAPKKAGIVKHYTEFLTHF